MSAIIQQELPKAFGQDQKAYTTLDNIKNLKKDFFKIRLKFTVMALD